MIPHDTFANRREAGRLLARALAARQLDQPVVLALPRGGVPVAAEIARELQAPLDIVLVRKVGVPREPELAAAAVVDGDTPEVVTNDDVIEHARLSRADLKRGIEREVAEIERRRRAYMPDRARVPLRDRTLIVVDDGIATGASMRAALIALRRRGPKAIVLAVPVAPRETLDELAHEVDDVVCLATPEPFLAIGLHYKDFHQLGDAEVVEILSRNPGTAPGVGNRTHQPQKPTHARHAMAKPKPKPKRIEERSAEELPPLSISTDKVCFVIVKAREFDAKDEVTEPDTGSNPTDDNMISVLEDHGDDPVLQELTAFISAMTEDEQIDLVALAWLGRDDNTIEDWASLREEAAEAHSTRKSHAAKYLLGTPLIGDYLEEGLAQFGRSCEGDEFERP